MKNLDKIMYRVRLRNGFSDRNKIKIENKDMQVNNLDDRSRIALINGLRLAWNLTFESHFKAHEFENYMIIKILSDVYLQEVNYYYQYRQDFVLEIMDATIKSDTYDSVFSLLEYTCRELENIFKKYDYNPKNSIYNIFNKIFEGEYIGYRFIDSIIVPITSEVETETINEVLLTKYETVANHFRKSLKFLSDREHPDFENSIKESISGVEAMCSALLNKKMVLSNALRQFEERGLIIHPALKEGFTKLYGYTSDADGVRHASGIGGKESTFEEARYMLISCSAFTNYLKSIESLLSK